MGILESFPPASPRLIWASDHAEEARTWGPGTDTKLNAPVWNRVGPLCSPTYLPEIKQASQTPWRLLHPPRPTLTSAALPENTAAMGREPSPTGPLICIWPLPLQRSPPTVLLTTEASPAHHQTPTPSTPARFPSATSPHQHVNTPVFLPSRKTHTRLS